VVRTICICGAGTMGCGIAQVSAQAGLTTILYDLNPEVLEKAKTGFHKTWQLLVEKGKFSATEMENIAKRLHFTSALQDCQSDAIIEAVVEKMEIKIALFSQLAGINDKQCIFASNTSSLSVSALAGQIKNPERFIGMHFFNPAPVMKLVEIVNTNYTDEPTTRVIIDLAKQMGKVPVVCKDSPGFIVNRVARPYYLEALRLVEEGISDFSTIDSLMEATGFKMGPFRLMDLIGNDINYAVSCSVFEQLNHPERLKPSPIQKEKVQKGELGKKTGRGYYDYSSPEDKLKS